MYLMNGNFKAGPNAYSFGQLNDPTPTIGGNFGTAWSALGDLVPAERSNELIIGGFASAAARDLAITDLWIFNAFYEKALQQIEDPDQQPNSKFGSRVVPLGDLNEDGFLDFVAAADGWDRPTGAADNNVGRVYIFRSDNSPPPVAAAAPAAAPAAAGRRRRRRRRRRHRRRRAGRHAVRAQAHAAGAADERRRARAAAPVGHDLGDRRRQRLPGLADRRDPALDDADAARTAR